ncbi:MAG: FG-GAP repeat protein [Nitrospirae bacterium]|nr:FG-GAP repeat protein [Nitrospirota bacterium]
MGEITKAAYQGRAGHHGPWLVALVLLSVWSGGCSKKKSADPVPLDTAVPLTLEQAAALNGVRGGVRAGQEEGVRGGTQEGVRALASLEVDAEGVRGAETEGVRGGVRAGVRGGVSGGVRGAEAQGVRGGVRAIRTRDVGISGRRDADDLTTSRPPDLALRREAASLRDLAYVVNFKLDDELDPGEHTIGVAVLFEDRPDIRFVDMAARASSGKTGLDADVPHDQVVLPDSDGDGVSDLIEVVLSEKTGQTFDPKDAGTRPRSEAQIKEIFRTLGQELVTTIKEQEKAERAAALAQAKGVAVDKLSDSDLAKIAQDVEAETQSFAAEVTSAVEKADLTPPATATVTASDGNGNPVASGGTTDSPDLTITFTCSETGCAFQCSLDGGPFKACTTATYGDLREGEHVLRVKATDTFGNSEAVPREFRWTVRLPAKGKRGPECGNGVCEAGEDPGSCPSDCSGAICGNGLCESGENYSGCPSDCTAPPPTPAGDTLPPQTTIVSAKASTGSTVEPGSSTADTAPVFTFSASEPDASATPGATFECALDSGDFHLCTSPHTPAAVTDGAHTLKVRAIDAANNADPTPAEFTWTQDTTPPDTTITTTDLSSLSGTISKKTSIAFTITSADAGTVLECDVDGGGFLVCTSPRTVTGLADGAHTFKARAKDPVGNLDATPAQATWTQDSSPPSTPGSFSASGGNKSVTLSWTASTDATGVSHYLVYYGTVSGSYNGTTASQGASPFQVTCSTSSCSSGLSGPNISNCFTYYLAVTATDTLGQESAKTAEKSAVTSIPAPGSVSATGALVGKITVSWDAVTNASGYVVRYGTSSGSYPSNLTVSAGTTSTDVPATGTTYAIVESRDGTCPSSPSSEVSATPKTLTLFTQETELVSGNLFGSSIAMLGDVNSNGRADWIVGIPMCGGADGCAHVYDSKGAGSSSCTSTANSCAFMTTPTPDGIEGHPNGPSLAQMKLGTSVSGGLDMNGATSTGDWVIGGPFIDQPTCNGGATAADVGGVIVYDGVNGSALIPTGVATLCGSGANNKFGASVAVIGDVTADGKAEFAAGAPGANAVYVWSHSSGSTFNMTSYSPLIIPSSTLGSAVAGRGDVNGDGKGDLIAGAETAFSGNSNGGAYVYCGATGQQLYAKGSEDNTCCMNGIGKLHSVLILGDVNGDSKAEFLMGVPWIGSSSSPGYVRVYSGTDGTQLYQVTGENNADEFGTALASVGDLNGDGKPDFAVGAIKWKSGSTKVGKIYVYSGTDGSLLGSYSPGTGGGLEADSDFGQAIAGGQDIDADGKLDIVVGAPADDVSGQTNSGNTFIVSFK